MYTANWKNVVGWKVWTIDDETQRTFGYKIQACSLVTDVDRSELHVAMEAVQAYLKVAKLANKGQIEGYTVRNLPKFASVPELKQFLLESYSVDLSPATNHSFTVGYMSDGRTKRDI